MKSFETVRDGLVRRERLLRALNRSGWALLGTLGLTMLALLFAIVDLTPMPAPFFWITANCLVAAVGFLWAWTRPLNMTDVLFRVDRAAGLGEKLVTLHELKSGHGAQGFVPLLEARFTQISLNVEKALTAKPSERYRWFGVLIFTVVCLGLSGIVDLGILVWNPSILPQSSATTSERPVSLPLVQSTRTVQLMQPPPAEIVQKLASLRELVQQARTALAQNASDARARATLEQLQAEIGAEQGRLLSMSPSDEDKTPLPSGEQRSQGDSSLAEGSPGDRASPPSSDDLPRGETTLDQLIRDLQQIQGQAQELTHEEMKKLLDELRSGTPEAAKIIEQTLQSSQNKEEFSQKLQEALKNVEARQSLSRQLEDLKRETQSALSQPPPPVPPAGQAGQPQQSGATGENTQQGQSSQETNIPETAETIEGSRQTDATSLPSGGKGTAPLDPDAAEDLPNLSQLRERAKSLSVPGAPEQDPQILFDIIVVGIPQDKGVPSTLNRVEINYQKVETLLDTMGIPPELRDSVRRYFLSLAQSTGKQK